MAKHLTREHILAYLEGKLPSQARQATWEHLRGCPRCNQVMQQEQRYQQELKQEISTLVRPRLDDLSALLPGILAETRRKTVPAPFNQRAILLALTMFVLTLLPVIPFLNGIPLQAMEDADNAPQATSTAQEIAATRETPPVSAAEQTLHIPFNIEYASPAPLPHATVAVSLTPR